MLPPFIIEQIRQREELQRRQHDQPRLELPIDVHRPAPPVVDDEADERGVAILDLG